MHIGNFSPEASLFAFYGTIYIDLEDLETGNLKLEGIGSVDK